MTLIPSEPAARTLRLYRLLLAGMALVWLGCEVAAQAGLDVSPAYLVLLNLGQQTHLTVALGSIFFLHIASNPGRRDVAAAAVLGFGVAAGFFLFRRTRGMETLPTNLLWAATGVGSLAVLTWRSWRTAADQRARVLVTLLPAALLAGAVALSLYLLRTTIVLCPVTDDPLLYAADDALGGQISFALGRLLKALPVLAVFIILIYALVPAAFVLLLILYQRADPLHWRSPLPTFLAASVVGLAIYYLFPAVGPLFCLSAVFPDSPPSVAEVFARPLTIDEPAVRNCMPSLHATWALLLCWHARPLARWFRILAAVFLVCTLLATVGLGLHYAIDLVVAFPFALAMQAATVPAPLRRRIATFVLGGALVVAWLLLIRFGLSLLTISRPLTATAALATVAISVVAEQRLWRSTLPFSSTPQPLHPVRQFDKQIAHEDQPAAKE